MSKELKEFRNSKKMSMQRMADEIGVSKSYYEKIEHGERRPSYNFMEKFINRFPDANINVIFFDLKTHVMCGEKL